MMVKAGKLYKIIAMVFVLALSLYIPSFPENVNVSGSKITDLSKLQTEIEKKLKEIANEKKELKNTSTKLQGELSWLNNKSLKEREKYEQLIDDMNAAYDEMNKAITEVRNAEKNLKDRRASNIKRLQTMFENRNRSTLEMLLSSEDLSTFLANAKFISIVADNDRKILDELNVAKDDAEQKSENAQKYLEEMQSFVDAKKKEIDALKKNIALTQTDLSEIKKDLEKAERDEKLLLEESKKIKEEIKKLQSSGAYYGGTMIWPVPGYTNLNPANTFGMRLHPIYKVMKMHTGIDIGGPYSAKIVAVADGKVILVRTIAGYNASVGNNTGGSGYGNYVIIDHGGGVASLYAHCKLIKVKNGDIIKTGQLVATMGSTGISTGPHLHFEIRENGEPVNPLQKKYLGVKSN